MSSGAAWKPYEGWATYCAGKAGVERFTQVIAAEEASSGLRAYSVAPGVVDTAMQVLIRDSADDFLTREAPAARMREIEWAREPDEELWRQMVELGWTGLPIAEAHGGQGAELVDLGVLIEQLSRHALLSPYPQTMLAAATVQRHGDEELRQALLPRIVAGQTCAPALHEGNGGLFGERRLMGHEFSLVPEVLEVPLVVHGLSGVEPAMVFRA